MEISVDYFGSTFSGYVVGEGREIFICQTASYNGSSFSLGAAAFGIFLLYSVETYAVADQWYVYEAARRLVDGTFDIQEYARYYQIYSFQLNLAQIYELIFRLTGSSNYRVLQVFHSICVGITLYTGFGIVRELSHRRAAELIYLVLGTLFIPMYIYALYIYGETIGVCCAMTAVWCFLKYNNCESVKGIIGYGILGAIAVTGFYQVRVALTIVWIAMLLIQVMTVLVKRKPLPLVMTVCMLLIAIGISGITQSVTEYRAGGVSLDNRMPTVLWVAMGLQENPDSIKGPGSYNAYNWSVFSMTQMDAQASSDIAVEYIKSRLPELLANPAEGIAFFGRKTMNQWNEPSYACFIVTAFYSEMDDWVKNLYFAEGNRKCLQFLNEYHAVVYLAVLLGFIRLVFGERSPQEYLLGVILIGGYLFSMVWEASSRYISLCSPYDTFCRIQSDALWRSVKE